jgi:pimeloyl-ACP methyl ester carboxylesterase
MVSGAGLAAEQAYAPLLDELGHEVQPVLHALELFARAEPPAGYTLDTEVTAIARAADDAGFGRFHLVAYSGGGGASLAFAAQAPQRLLSLALIEPAWAGNDLPAEEQALWEQFERISRLPTAEVMPAFVAIHMAPNVPAPDPPAGTPPPWMARVPARLPMLIDAFRSYHLDMTALARLQVPVYYAVGDLSNPDYFARQGDRLRSVFTDFTYETFEGLHHFDPPHRAAPSRMAAALRSLWSRADPSTVAAT